MPLFDPHLLAAWSGGIWTTVPVVPLTGFSHDSRELKSGDVFVAIRTQKRDGHDFLSMAAESGCNAAIVQRANPALDLPQLIVADPLKAFQDIAREHRRAFTGSVVGISGSAGKTSTKNLLALLLGGDAAGVLATEGNLNNHLGVPLTLTRLDSNRHRIAVIEAGISEPGDMAPLAAMIEPDVSIITLVGPAHVEALGSVEGVAREKAILSASVKPSGIAIFPRSCCEYGPFRDLKVKALTVERAEVIRPTLPPKDKVYYAITQRGDRTAIAIAYGTPPPLQFSMLRSSDGMAQNAVLAICAALWLGVSSETIQGRLEKWTPAPMRGEIRREGDRLLYLDCYNANPSSMHDALKAFEAVSRAELPRLYVIGGMEELGTMAVNFHRTLGEAIKLRPQDRLMTIGDHASAVRDGLLRAGNSDDQIEIVLDLIPISARIAEFKGSVFIKGSRRYQLEKSIKAGTEAPAGAH